MRALWASSMAHPKEKQLQLRAAYIGGLPLEQAAQHTGVPHSSARRWKGEAKARGDDWDKFQAASLIVAGGGFDQSMGRVAAAVLLRAEAVIQRLQDPEIDPLDAARAIASLSDSLGKAKAAMRALMPETDVLAVETGAVKAFVELLIRLHPASAAAALAAMEAFAQGQR